ncbi:MAG TPA: ATP-dependent protease, partial [Nevskiaceae bacterium]|nr:ATP-dependent protease [Nevskiaceae bacterium]
IDLQLFVSRVERDALSSRQPAAAETSAEVRQRVVDARRRQLARQGKPNHQLQPKEIDLHCAPEAEAHQLLLTTMSRLQLSARAYHRVLKVARTIADLAACGPILAAHVAEAVRYRELDRGA